LKSICLNHCLFFRFNALHSFLDYEFYFILRTTRTTSVFLFRFGELLFCERGAKRKREKLNYPVGDKNRKSIQRTRENLPKDRLSRFTLGGCLSWNRLPGNRSALGRTRTFWEPKIFCAQATTECGAEHSAFDRTLGVCEVKSGLQVGEAKALFCSPSDVNNCCHKNVIVASHSWRTLAAVGCGG